MLHDRGDPFNGATALHEDGDEANCDRLGMTRSGSLGRIWGATGRARPLARLRANPMAGLDRVRLASKEDRAASHVCYVAEVPEGLLHTLRAGPTHKLDSVSTQACAPDGGDSTKAVLPS